MVQKRIVELVDDLDGGIAEETVTFGIDGKVYELDLSSVNADALRGILAPYISAGRRSRASARTGRQGGRASAEVDIAAVRVWAVENGYAVNTRGRIPAPILDAYTART
jgi:Lsr2